MHVAPSVDSKPLQMFISLKKKKKNSKDDKQNTVGVGVGEEGLLWLKRKWRKWVVVVVEG